MSTSQVVNRLDRLNVTDKNPAGSPLKRFTIGKGNLGATTWKPGTRWRIVRTNPKGKVLAALCSWRQLEEAGVSEAALKSVLLLMHGRRVQFDGTQDAIELDKNAGSDGRGQTETSTHADHYPAWPLEKKHARKQEAWSGNDSKFYGGTTASAAWVSHEMPAPQRSFKQAPAPAVDSKFDGQSSHQADFVKHPHCAAKIMRPPVQVRATPRLVLLESALTCLPACPPACLPRCRPSSRGRPPTSEAPPPPPPSSRGRPATASGRTAGRPSALAPTRARASQASPSTPRSSRRSRS